MKTTFLLSVFLPFCTLSLSSCHYEFSEERLGAVGDASIRSLTGDSVAVVPVSRHYGVVWDEGGLKEIRIRVPDALASKANVIRSQSLGFSVNVLAPTQERVDSLFKKIEYCRSASTLELNASPSVYVCEMRSLNGDLRVRGSCFNELTITLPAHGGPQVFINDVPQNTEAPLTLEQAKKIIESKILHDKEVAFERLTRDYPQTFRSLCSAEGEDKFIDEMDFFMDDEKLARDEIHAVCRSLR